VSDSIRFANTPGLAQQTPIHAREIALALPQFGCKEGHALDETGIATATAFAQLTESVLAGRKWKQP